MGASASHTRDNTAPVVVDALVSPSASRPWGGAEILRLLGGDLDAGRAPRVFPRGVLWPSAAFPSHHTSAQGNSEGVNANGATTESWEGQPAGASGPAGADGPAAGPREGAAGRAAAGARRQAGATAPQLGAPPLREAAMPEEAPMGPSFGVAGRDDTVTSGSIGVGILPSHVATELRDVARDYPQLGLRRDGDVVWLSGTISPIPNYAESFSLVVALPLDATLPARAWAWWSCGVAVGPRHVNPDGSICAYEPGDAAQQWGDWQRGSSLVAFLDFVAVWLVRQCYWRDLGRWPGPQMLHTMLERLEWNGMEEFCGCGARVRYAACHAARDHAATLVDIARELRLPVPEVVALRESLRRRAPPRDADALQQAALAPAPVLRLVPGVRRGVRIIATAGSSMTR